MRELWKSWSKTNLIVRISIGLAVGTILGVFIPWVATTTNTPAVLEYGSVIGFIGVLFVSALKAIAPLLVFFLVMSALLQRSEGTATNMKHIVFLYILSTFIAASVAVIASFMFPTTLKLVAGDAVVAPEGISEVINSLLLNLVDNPIKALYNANYIGILASSVLFGIALRNASESTKIMITDTSNAISKIVKWIIELAPFGIMGLIYSTISVGGLGELFTYGRLILVLVGCMLFVSFVTNPLIVFLNTKRNPYPIVLRCLKESGVYAFFTRSSAANIPINMQLCEDLGLDRNTYAVSIPLGATINMAGAAITINVLTLAAAYTLGIDVDIPTAILLSVVASVSACGASGVAGGSLLLIPLACSLFGIPADISAQVVGVGFVIGVIQDSVETGLNSSTDVLLTATAEYRDRIKRGVPVDMNAKVKKS